MKAAEMERRGSSASGPQPDRRMAMVKLRILGECVIEVGDRCIGPESPQLFAFLLYLGSEAGTIR